MVAKKIWIDLDNSPHVAFFKPIMDELNTRGYPIVLTARDCFQTCGLADLAGLKYKRIGKHHGKNKIIKLAGLTLRSMQLMPTILKEKPGIALSHGSRAQLMLASLLRIPSIAILDYEFVDMIPFAYPDWLIVPEVLGKFTFKIPENHILKYPGIKENVYLPSFKPDPEIGNELGIHGAELIVTIRPPANEAHYYVDESGEFFKAVMDYFVPIQGIRIILLPRNEKQEKNIRENWAESIAKNRVIIPKHVVNGLNLLWHSDLVISGGGTMNREAAALGVPVYSIFRGKLGAVDRYLSEKGQLILIEKKEQIYSKIVLTHRNKSINPASSNNPTLKQIVSHIVNIAEGTSVLQ